MAANVPTLGIVDLGPSGRGPADPDAASRFARRLRTGQVTIYGVRTRVRPGASGGGRELGEHGIVEMREMTAVMA